MNEVIAETEAVDAGENDAEDAGEDAEEDNNVWVNATTPMEE
jgi:hypothetical protein